MTSSQTTRIVLHNALLPAPSNLAKLKLSRHDGKGNHHGTWSHRGTRSKLHSLLDIRNSFKTLPRHYASSKQPAAEETTETELTPYQTMMYSRLGKLKKQREELQRIHSMLEELENTFLGTLDTPYKQHTLEVTLKKDYMLSAGNPETLVEKGEGIKVFGYLGHNNWRCIGSFCKGNCHTINVINPKIRSQNQVVDVDLVCNSCNKIRVPLIGAVPSSILQPLTITTQKPD